MWTTLSNINTAQLTIEWPIWHRNIEEQKVWKGETFSRPQCWEITVFLQGFCAPLKYSNMINSYKSTGQTCAFILGTVFCVMQKDFLCKRLIYLTKF